MFIKGNEVTIKCGGVGCGEAQAVFGIETILLILGPWADVACAKHIKPPHAWLHTFAATIRESDFANSAGIVPPLVRGRFADGAGQNEMHTKGGVALDLAFALLAQEPLCHSNIHSLFCRSLLSIPSTKGLAAELCAFQTSQRLCAIFYQK